MAPTTLRAPLALAFAAMFALLLLGCSDDSGVDTEIDEPDPVVTTTAPPTTAPPTTLPQFDPVEIDQAWSGMPVGFDFLAHEDRQFAAYFAYPTEIDAAVCTASPKGRCGQVTVAARQMRDDRTWGAWQTQRLESWVGWDSHNYLRLHIDGSNQIHLTGNMHASKMWYLRSTRPLDITSLVPAEMVGTSEVAVTYPRFLEDAQGRLHLVYRQGGSGAGFWVMNRYDPAATSWSRLVERLFDNKDEVGTSFNAYHELIERDGSYHAVWTWRRTSDASTNADVHYAVSDDLENWRSIDGTPLTLPINASEAESLVKAIPEGHGVINGSLQIGFDGDDDVVVSYQRYDNVELKLVQVYNARFEGQQWVERQLTDWRCPWDFKGGGSLDYEVRVFPVVETENGDLTQRSWCSADPDDSGNWELSDELEAGALAEPPARVGLPRPANTSILGDPYLVRRAELRDASAPDLERYVLKWETLPRNRDQPHPELPEPAQLTVYHAVAKP